MTKADLVEKVTGLGDLTRRDGEVIVETIFSSVIGALQSGDKIEIRGFGSFRIRQRNPRIGRNPKTGERVDLALAGDMSHRLALLLAQIIMPLQCPLARRVTDSVVAALGQL